MPTRETLECADNAIKEAQDERLLGKEVTVKSDPTFGLHISSTRDNLRFGHGSITNQDILVQKSSVNTEVIINDKENKSTKGLAKNARRLADKFYRCVHPGEM